MNFTSGFMEKLLQKLPERRGKGLIGNYNSCVYNNVCVHHGASTEIASKINFPTDCAWSALKQVNYTTFQLVTMYK